MRRILALLVITAASLAATGATGRSSTQLFGPTDAFYSVTSLPSGKWFVVGASGVFLTSDDDGKTWTRTQLAKIYPFSWLDLFSIRFAPDRVNGWISGEQGLILRTTDAGKSWQKQQSGVTDNIYRVAPVDAQNAVAAGVNGTLLYTHDGGQSWQPARQKNGFAFFDATAPDASNAWVVGEFETILHSSDGGKTWTAQSGGKRGNFRQPAYFTVRFRDNAAWLGHRSGGDDSGDLGRRENLAAGHFADKILDVRNGLYRRRASGWRATMACCLMRAWTATEGLSRSSPLSPFSTTWHLRVRRELPSGLTERILKTDDGGGHWKKVSQE